MKLRLFTAIAVTAMALVSCSEDTEYIGSSITSNTDKLVFSTGTYNATSRSILADSVYTHNPDRYFGMVKDPETNSYVKSSMMAQFNMVEGFTLPSIDNMLSKEDGEVIADSCEITLFIRYSKTYGDTLAAMKMRMSELDKPVDDAYTHYSNFDLRENGFIREGGLEVSKMFSMRDLTKSSDALAALQKNISSQGTSADSGYYDHIRVPLNMPYKAKNGNTYKNYGTYVLRTYYDHPEYFQNSYWFVHNVCPGFNFEITDGLGVMANVFAISFNIYYNVDRSGTSSKTSVYLATTPEVMQTSHIVNDLDALEVLVNDNSCTYIKSPAGIFTEVTMPIDEITQAHANDSLLQVSVNFMRENSDVAPNKYSIGAPANLLMVHKDSLYTFFENQVMYDYKSTYAAALTQNAYSFSNIGNLVTLMARAKAEGLKSDPNWVANHPDWNKVVLVPISTTLKYSSNSYGTTTSTVSSVQHNMGLSSTKLVGGANNPIEIKVIYAKFND